MGHVEIVIAGLLVVVVGLSALARYLSVPYPVVLVAGGAMLRFVPGLPQVTLDPEVVLVVFLPPLLYGASIFANVGDLRANVRGLAFNDCAIRACWSWRPARSWSSPALTSSRCVR